MKLEISSVPCSMFHAPCRRGFALVELLVALAIFGIVTAFVLLAYGKVNSELRTTSLAYEVALSFREAQSYGVSVRAVQIADAPTEDEKEKELKALDSAYGLHFENNNYYTLFVDKMRDKTPLNPLESIGQTRRIWRYDGQEDESGCITNPFSECVSIFKIGQGNFIEKFCGVTSEREECNTGAFSITALDVSFQRPNPDAIIRTDPDRNSNYKSAKVYLKSAQGVRRIVEVGITGQISIK